MSVRSTKGRRRGALSLNALVAATAILAAGLYLWQRSAPVSAEPEWESVEVRRETLRREVSALGVVRPKVGAEIDVGSRISGIVRSIPVEVGDRVAQGDLLALIDPTELEAELEQARADLAMAEAQLAPAVSSHERIVALIDDGIVPANALDEAARDLEAAQASVELQQARIKSAEIKLAYTDIRAPIRGVVADITTREGETVAASFAAPTFVTILDLDRLEVLAYVDETDIGRVVPGQKATFTVDTYSDAEFDAVVTSIDPKAELQNGVVNYIVRLAYERREGYLIRPEMTAHVELEVESRKDVLTVPRKAVRRDFGRELVTVERDDRWMEQEIETGWRSERVVEITAGLTEGERVQLNQE